MYVGKNGVKTRTELEEEKVSRLQFYPCPDMVGMRNWRESENMFMVIVLV
jgi:hypothetical protein